MTTLYCHGMSSLTVFLRIQKLKKKGGKGPGSAERTNEGLPHCTVWPRNSRLGRLRFKFHDGYHSWPQILNTIYDFPLLTNLSDNFDIFALFELTIYKQNYMQQTHGRMSKTVNCLAHISRLPPNFMKYSNKISSRKFRAAMG